MAGYTKSIGVIVGTVMVLITSSRVLAFEDNEAFTTSQDKLWSVDLTDGSEKLIGTAFGTQWLSAPSPSSPSS